MCPSGCWFIRKWPPLGGKAPPSYNCVANPGNAHRAMSKRPDDRLFRFAACQARQMSLLIGRTFRSGIHDEVTHPWRTRPCPGGRARDARGRLGVGCALGRATGAGGARPWTTSRVVGSPDPPPPFKVVRAFPNLKFEHPLLMARAPGSNRLFVGEQAGVLYSFADKPDAKAELFFDLRKETQDDAPAARGEGGRGGLRAGLPSRLREESPVLRLLHAAGQEAGGTT